MKNHDMDEQEFLNDIGYIIELTKIIDSMFSKSNRKTYQYLKRLRKIVDRFNHKYSQIMAAIDKTSLAIKLKLFMEQNINFTFMYCSIIYTITTCDIRTYNFEYISFFCSIIPTHYI